MAMWRQKQKLEGCGHKPRSTRILQMLQEVKGSPLELLEGAKPCWCPDFSPLILILDFWPPEFGRIHLPWAFLFLTSFMAWGILVPWPGIKPTSLTMKAHSLNHWTAREVLICGVLKPASLWWYCYGSPRKQIPAPSFIPRAPGPVFQAADQ